MRPLIWWLVGLLAGVVFLFSGCARKSGVFKVGVIAPFSGPSAQYGEDIRRGYLLAVEEINAQGGVRGRKLQLLFEDSEGKPEKAVSAARKLIFMDKVKVILGPLWSSPVLAVAPICEREKVVLLSSGASSPKITKAGDYIFRNEISDAYGAQKAAELYFKAGFRRIAILYINNDYGVGVKEVTEKVYRSLGGKVLLAEAFEQDATDFRTPLLKIASRKPQALLIVAYKEAILILRQMEELGIHLQILGTPLMEDRELVEKCGKMAEGIIYAYYGTFDPASRDKRIQEFLRRFQKRFNTMPGYYAPLGYDAVYILAEAIKKGGFTAEGIKNALYKIRDFPGLTGRTSFDRNGDVIKPVILKIIKNGQFKPYLI